MYIKLKPEHDPFRVGKWQRIRYNTFMGWHPSDRVKYETRVDFEPSPKQRFSLAKGGLFRHVKSAKAQLALVQHHLGTLKTYGTDPTEFAVLEVMLQTSQAYISELIKEAEKVLPPAYGNAEQDKKDSE